MYVYYGVKFNVLYNYTILIFKSVCVYISLVYVYMIMCV